MNPVRIYRTILTAAGEQAGVLKRCLRDSIAAALLQGAGFAMLLPAFLALGAGKNGRAAFWLALLTVLLALSALFRWRSQDYDYQGYCARAGDAARRKMGEHLRRIPLQILYRKRSGELNALLAGTIDETYNHTLIVSNMLIAAVCTPLATALLAMLWDWLGLALLFSFPLIVPIQQWTQPFTERARARLAGANARLNAELLEYSQGLPVLKAANSTGSRLPRLQQAVGEVETIQREALLAEALPNALLGITFENVHYHYDANPEPILRGVSLHIPERALTALVGHSGCGKTTLIRLIMRYADPQQGRILIGGTDIRALTQEDLMRQISVVFQDVYLFDDTIANNIRLGKANASDAEIEAAARTARCHDFIMAMPESYQTRVGDIGGKLSSGEKQRISIARALLKNAPIIILDEPTAALDTESEVAVQQAIDALVQDKTVIVITHRLSTVSGAQQIIVLSGGQVAESGTHSELLAQNGVYRRLWQAGGWEED
ncbi:ABC transporter ATP-binding protein [Kingella bonacorsii]|uniref:ATP-binding cassette domain-containing protein n=1 Tax=Kingella bonacorsii TaxID=2796361 RepID=A0ABS1BQ13_9NEIS|nr:ATP-binding cassette domain-containing protein [Kingella bonacorsii]MBK0395272.1 ATP-binding cassette domain-containing protein [Kingella bonacorsii]